MEMKTCNKCKESYPIDSFPKAKGKPRSYCAECNRTAAREYDRKIRTNPEYKVKKAARDRKRFLKGYGLTEEDVYTALEEQNGKCAICSVDITAKYYVDHDHDSGKFRQLLCFHCNVGLGHFRDDVDRMLVAIEYLRRHSDRAELLRP